MSRKSRSGVLAVAAAVALLAAGPAGAVLVGWNVDIHQGKWNGYYWPPGVPFVPPYPLPTQPPFPTFANDFHVWGVVESMLSPPTLVNSINFETTGPFGMPPWKRIPPPGGLMFPTFANFFSQVPPFPRPLPPMAPPILPGGPFYYFEAKWLGQNIPFCRWMHFGLLFRVNGANYGYWLQGMWTWNGIDPPSPPIYGFEVGGGLDTVGGQISPPYIRIGNSSEVETFPHAMDLMVLGADEGRAFPLEDLNTDFFDTHPEWNQRWVHVPPEMVPPMLGGPGTVDSFFDVFLDEVPGLPPLLPGQVLLARQASGYYDSSYPSEGGEQPTQGNVMFWQYEIHGQPLPGDIDDTGHVDVIDLLWFVDAFGSYTGDANYNPLADFDFNGGVDVVDLLWLVQFFGW